MRICLLAPATSIHTQRWARALAERGYEVRILSLHRAAEPLLDLDVEYLPRPTGTKVDYFLALPVVRRRVERWRPDIVHAHYATSYGLLGVWVRFHPWVLSVWGSDLLDFPKFSPLHRALVRYILEKPDQILATSPILAQAVRDLARTAPAVEIIPFGVDIEKFTPRPNRSVTNGVTIGVVKTLEPKYGIEYLIRAFAILRARFPNVSLVVVGGGRLRRHLEELSRSLGVPNHITFSGSVPHERVVDYLHTFDIFVVPSVLDSETFGVAAVEAAACGLPVVASNVGGLPGVVRDGVTGFLVPPRNPQALADTLERLIRNPNLRTRMGQAGRDMVLEQYRWEKCVDRQEEVYARYAPAKVGNSPWAKLSESTVLGIPDALPLVSIIVPVRNEQASIGGCLISLLGQDYPRDLLEILVVDGMSMDGTRDTVHQFMCCETRVRLLENPQKIVPTAMNIGIRQARGTVVMRADAHTLFPKNYLRQCIVWLEQTGAACVGGVTQASPGARGLLPQALALSLSTPFGVGNARFRLGAKRPTEVDAVAFGCHPRSVFERVGLFDERLLRNQDIEFFHRLRLLGGKIFLLPDLQLTYLARSSLSLFLLQSFRNGYWNVLTERLKPGTMAWRHFIPLLFVAGILVGLAFSWTLGGRLGLFALLGLYSLAAGGSAFVVALREGFRCFWLLPWVFLSLHLSYGAGSLWGLVRVSTRRL